MLSTLWVKLVFLDIATWIGMTVGIYWVLCLFMDFLYGDKGYDQYYKDD